MNDKDLTTQMLINAMPDGGSVSVPLAEEAGAEIWMKNEYYFLFSIPQYGGFPVFERTYRKNQIDDLIKTINSWT